MPVQTCIARPGHPRVLPALFLGVLGCADPGPSTTPAGDSGSSDLPDFEAAPATPTYDGTEIEAMLADFLAMGTPAPPAIGDAFGAYMAQGDEICPGDEEVLVQNGADGCTASTGYYYRGIGTLLNSQEHINGITYITSVHFGDYVVASPDGLRMTGGGEVLLTAEVDDANSSLEMSMEVEGSFKDEAGDPWLAEGYSALLNMEADGPPGEVNMTLNGGFGIGSAFFLDFSEVVASEDSECPWEPQGQISVRDDVGYWYELDATADCDPCAPVVFQPTGEVVGEVCTDLSSMMMAMYFLSVPL